MGSDTSGAQERRRMERISLAATLGQIERKSNGFHGNVPQLVTNRLDNLSLVLWKICQEVTQDLEMLKSNRILWKIL